MALIQDNQMLTTEAKKSAESIRLALFGGLFPSVEEKNGRKYILFSNGKDNVFVTNKSLNQLAYVANLNNASRAAGVKVNLSPFTNLKDGDAQAARKVYEAINNKYIGESVERQDNAMDMFFAEEETRESAGKVGSYAEIGASVPAKLAFMKVMTQKFPQMAREVGLNSTMTNAAMDALRQDIKHVEAYRERIALRNFDEVEKE